MKKYTVSLPPRLPPYDFYQLTHTQSHTTGGQNLKVSYPAFSTSFRAGFITLIPQVYRLRRICTSYFRRRHNYVETDTDSQSPPTKVSRPSTIGQRISHSFFLIALSILPETHLPLPFCMGPILYSHLIYFVRLITRKTKFINSHPVFVVKE